MGFGASRTPRLDNYRLRRTVSIDDMINIQSTLMRAGFGIRQATRYPVALRSGRAAISVRSAHCVAAGRWPGRWELVQRCPQWGWGCYGRPEALNCSGETPVREALVPRLAPPS
jgi:hypothetical protein